MKKTVLFIVSILFTISLCAQSVPYKYHPHKKDVSFTSSDLPIVVIKLDEAIKDKSEDQRTNATITILNRKDGQENKMSDLNGTPNYTNSNLFNYHGKIGIKFRGSTSFNNNNGTSGLSGKVPFTIRTIETDGTKRDVNLLGMGAHYDWVLIAPFADKSLIRDVLTFELQKDYFDYTPRAQYCELVIDGTTQGANIYQGVYILVARARRGENRIDLPKPGKNGDDTGGYLLNIDRYDATEDGFYSKKVNRKSNGQIMSNPGKDYRTYFQCIYPDSTDYTPKQFDYIKTFIDELEDALLDPKFDDPIKGRYRDYIDATSAIDYILTQEFTANADGYRLSTPIYKYNDDKDPHLKFSIWDINMAYGNINYLWYPGHRGGRPSTEGWLYDEQNDLIEELNHNTSAPFWFSYMMKDESFAAELRQRWCEYRSTTHSDDQLNHKIDSLATLLEKAQVRNYKAWPVLNDSRVFPGQIVTATWEEQIEELRYFLLDRVMWMDREFGITPVKTITGGTAMPSVACQGVKVTITAAPAAEGYRFYRWEGEGADRLEKKTSATTSFIMNKSNVNLKATYYNILDTENTLSEQHFIYPNPAKEYIKISNLKEGEPYAIVNQVGKTLLTGTGKNEETINISSLPEGTYIIKAGNDSMSFIKK